MSTFRAHVGAAAPDRARTALARSYSHAGFAVAEAALLLLFVALSLLVKANPGPLPGDVGLEVGFQNWIGPHSTVANFMDLASTIAWPIQSAITVGAVTILLLITRRWLDAVVALALPGIANGTNYLLSNVIQRPRPGGHGLYIAQHVGVTHSFPSGHVLQAVVFFGFLLFLTFVVSKPAAWLWVVRVVLALIIVDMGPSRLLEGEHWPSDVLGSLLYGAVWLALAIHVYVWIGNRWPTIRGAAPSVATIDPV